MSRHTLRVALGIDNDLWSIVQEAARDAHMETRDYCRLMVLAASGQGGVTEHLERAIAASGEVDDRPCVKVAVRGKAERR